MRRRTGISKTNIEILREHGCLAGTGNAVQTFAPPVVSRNTKPFYCRCIIYQLAGFL